MDPVGSILGIHGFPHRSIVHERPKLRRMLQFRMEDEEEEEKEDTDGTGFEQSSGLSNGKIEQLN